MTKLVKDTLLVSGALNIFGTCLTLLGAQLSDQLNRENALTIVLILCTGYCFNIMLCACALDSEQELNKRNEEDARLGRHWVWDKFDSTDPDLSKGHYEYDNKEKNI